MLSVSSSRSCSVKVEYCVVDKALVQAMRLEPVSSLTGSLSPMCLKDLGVLIDLKSPTAET